VELVGTLNANCTLTISSLPARGDVDLLLTNSGAYTLTIAHGGDTPALVPVPLSGVFVVSINKPDAVDIYVSVQGGGSLSPSRSAATETVVALASGGRFQGTCSNLPGPGIRIIQVTTNRIARVRLYDTVAHRTSDAARPVGTPPVADDGTINYHGVLLDVVTYTGVLDIVLSPAVDVHAVSPIPITIDNLGATGDTTVTFYYIRTEA